VGQMGQEGLYVLYWLMNGGGWWTETQWDRWNKILHILYWLVNGCVWWTKRQWDSWDKTNGVVC
jgi:hypothetical protein